MCNGVTGIAIMPKIISFFGIFTVCAFQQPIFVQRETQVFPSMNGFDRQTVTSRSRILVIARHATVVSEPD
jgi:hypothetical protein